MTKKNVLNLSLLVLVVVTFAWVWQVLHKPDTLPIRTVRVLGAHSPTAQVALQGVIKKFVKTGFFAVDIVALQSSLIELGWVATVSISRVWPDTLVIRVTEQKPVARWGATGLLNDEGKFFKALTTAQLSAELPFLEGPPGTEKEVLDQFRTMDRQVSQIGLHIVALYLSPRRAWSMRLNNGMYLLLGQKSVSERLERFVMVYNGIFGSKGSETKQIDLRYPNGIAVRWNEQKVGT
ncbi:MAG: cell division protein FtsQ/DivIB [Proteobacteria bacterium]|nr:cell division protein FtsQ/DivIB [Pseudomonadota bacterium]